MSKICKKKKKKKKEEDLNFSCCIYVMFNETPFTALSTKKNNNKDTYSNINMYIMKLQMIIGC